MLHALSMVLRLGMKVPGSPFMFNSFDLKSTYQTENAEVTNSERPVPKAAPATPISQRNMNM